MIIATDLDGTLTGDGDRITPENIQAIEMAKRYGVTCVLATGRPSRCLNPERDRLDLFDAVITCNGAERMLTFGSRLFAPLSPIHISAVAAALRGHAIAGAFAFEFGESVGFEPHYGGWPANDIGTTAVVAPFAALQVHGDCGRLLFLPDDAECDQIVALLEEDLGEAVSVTHSNPLGRRGPIEISSASATKGNALAAWLKESGREGEQLIAFGDQLNDLSMLRIADQAFVVGPAHPRLAELFSHLPNDAGTGVARYVLDGLLAPFRRDSHGH
ncbi:HAD hydrolase family protein [Streptomyces sp. NPDC004752]